MLVDTSVWIDHVRRPVAHLVALLETGGVTVHPFVIGELACGHLKPRAILTRMLGRLPRVPTVDHGEALQFLEQHKLAGRGVGWIDVHLLASARMADVALWTRDRRMAAVAREIGLKLFDG
jgi:predicted nucleic acid-binding protein